VSYADIARMATINMSHNLTMSAMLNTSSWPSVPPKTLSEPDKVPQDYYPSLDELQYPERKARQHQVQSNHAEASLGLSFEKPLSPTLTKMKNSSDRKKAEAQEEAINKNIQVFKYVQDIEKMHESLTQATEHKEQKTSNNYSPNSNETIVTNAVTPRYNNSTTMNYNPVDTDNNPSCTVNNKDSVTLPRVNNPRSRRNYVHSNQNVQIQGSHEEQHIKKSASSYHEEAIKKTHNIDSSQSESRTNPTIALHDGADLQKLKTAKPTQDSQNVEPESGNKTTSSDPRTARITKEYQTTAMKYDATKVGVCQPQNSKQDNQQREHDAENKKTKSQNAHLDKDQSQRMSAETQTKSSTPRPAVILLDETSSDIAKNNNLPTELTFGFEINEQLLLSEDNGNEETPIVANPVFSPAVPPLINKPPPNNFERNPPLFTEKPVRYDKFSSNYHMQQPNAHVTPANAHPVTPVHPVMVQPLPYMSYPRFVPPTYLPPPPPPPPGIMEKFHPPKEDFSMLYVAPEEELNVQTYNHDKIVSFVGLGKTVTFSVIFNRGT